MEENIMVNFNKINFMVKVLILIKTVKNLKVILKMVKNMVRVKLYSQMVEFIMDFGKMIKRLVLPLILVNKERVLLELGILQLKVLYQN